MAKQTDKENIRAKKAAALQYDPTQNGAPIITAVGSGYVAQKMIEQALQNDVPVAEDAHVADVLSRFSKGDAIPPELYAVVAQILVFVAETDSAYKEKLGRADKSR